MTWAALRLQTRLRLCACLMGNTEGLGHRSARPTAPRTQPSSSDLVRGSRARRASNLRLAQHCAACRRDADPGAVCMTPHPPEYAARWILGPSPRKTCVAQLSCRLRTRVCGSEQETQWAI